MGNTTSAPILITGPHDPSTLASGYFTFLRQFRQYDEAPFVFGNPISFYNGQDRSNWRKFLEDASDRACFSEFWNVRKENKTTWIGLFITLTQSPVKHQWDQLEWHCWGAAVIKDPGLTGKHILIYDCDPYTTTVQGKRRKEVLSGYQERFVKHAERQGQILSVWYNTDDSRAWKGQCISNTCDWIAKMARKGDRELTRRDSRLRNFKRFERK